MIYQILNKLKLSTPLPSKDLSFTFPSKHHKVPVRLEPCSMGGRAADSWAAAYARPGSDPAGNQIIHYYLYLCTKQVGSSWNQQSLSSFG